MNEIEKILFKVSQFESNIKKSSSIIELLDYNKCIQKELRNITNCILDNDNNYADFCYDIIVCKIDGGTF